MIAKAKSIAHGGVSLGYITRQGKAQVVKLNHLPEDASPQAIYGYMKLHQKLREEEFQRRPLKNNMIRMEISPSKEESKGWTLEDWKRLAEDFVQVFDRIRRPSSPSRLQPRRYGQLPEQRPPDRHPCHDGRRGDQPSARLETHGRQVRGEQSPHQEGLLIGLGWTEKLLLGEVHCSAGSQRIYRQAEAGCLCDRPGIHNPEWEFRL